MDAGPMPSAIRMHGVSKTFDGRAALREASVEVEWGELHAILGQNGAGKSTLMNIACGLYAADAGAIAIDGKPAVIRGPTDATRHGIGMVHQHYKLVPRFSVAENILLFCGEKLGIRSVAAATEAAANKAKEVGLQVRPEARISDLSLAEQQRVEILKVLLMGARILVMDEPTAVLTDQESEAVLQFLREMATQGTAVILITHKLREVTGFASRVTVMRDGTTVLSGSSTRGLERGDLARLMVGEVAAPIRPHVAAGRGKPRVEVRELTMPRDDGAIGIQNISFSVPGGHIYGIAGVGGNGQSELFNALSGLERPTAGSVMVDGHDVTRSSVAAHRRRGVRTIPTDRFRTGLLADMMVYENYGITDLATGRFGSWLRVSRRRMRAEAARAIESYRIFGCTPTTRTRLLSGGNAQKLLLARELGSGMAIVIAHSPTRGLDVQASHAVHDELQQAAQGGAACILISEDLEEILALSSSVAVISRGRIVGEFPGDRVSRDQIGALMLGHA